ncbi:MAG: hypothetical protein ABII22_02825 [Candidatus Micrarchaeota archaeon]
MKRIARQGNEKHEMPAVQMAMQRLRSFSRTANFLLVCGAAIGVLVGGFFAASSIISSEQKRAAQIREIENAPKPPEPKSKRTIFYKYLPQTETLLAYDLANSKRNVLTSEWQFKPGDVFEGTKPMAMTVTTDNIIWWVTENKVYTGKINLDISEAIELQQVVSHVTLPEKTPPATVIGAGILAIRDEKMPYVATVTNDGWIHVFRPPQNGPTIVEKYLIPPDDTWPIPHPLSARVAPLSPDEVAVIPLCDIGCTTTIYYYYGRSVNPTGKIDTFVTIFDLKEEHQGLKAIPSNIVGAEQITYNEERGGLFGPWVSALRVLGTDGNIYRSPTKLIPSEVIEQRRAMAEPKK